MAAKGTAQLRSSHMMRPKEYTSHGKSASSPSSSSGASQLCAAGRVGWELRVGGAISTGVAGAGNMCQTGHKRRCGEGASHRGLFAWKGLLFDASSSILKRIKSLTCIATWRAWRLFKYKGEQNQVWVFALLFFSCPYIPNVGECTCKQMGPHTLTVQLASSRRLGLLRFLWTMGGLWLWR
jgi:hypothetical protein